MNAIDWFRVTTFLVVVLAGWCVTGWLKRTGRLRCGDARKINHTLVLAGGAAWFGWLEAGAARASALAAGLPLVALVPVVCRFRRRPPFSWAFAGNTRVSDAPHEALYFWSSWFLSGAALLGIDWLLADVAVTRAAAVLVGVGDGVGELVGSRFGRHRFAVPSLRGAAGSTRSLEGSAAVALGCFLTVLLCFGAGGGARWAELVTVAGVVGLALAVVEALSPHGLDNVTIPAASAVLLRGFLWTGLLCRAKGIA
jgi:phytol kinase